MYQRDARGQMQLNLLMAFRVFPDDIDKLQLRKFTYQKRISASGQF